jgi:mRNA interferase RelE/StbE
MEPYKIVFKPSVEKDLRCLPHTVLTRVLSKIQQLQVNPISRESVKISGAEHFYRVRVGEYRVIYSIDRNEMAIIIHYVRHRRHAYSNFT